MKIENLNIETLLQLKGAALGFYDRGLSDLKGIVGNQFQKKITLNAFNKIYELAGVMPKDFPLGSNEDIPSVLMNIAKNCNTNPNDIAEIYSNIIKSDLSGVIHTSSCTIWGEEFLTFNAEPISDAYDVNYLPDLIMFTQHELVDFLTKCAKNRPYSKVFHFIGEMGVEEISKTAGIDTSVIFDSIAEAEYRFKIPKYKEQESKIKALEIIGKLDEFIINYIGNDYSKACNILNMISIENNEYSDYHLIPKIIEVDGIGTVYIMQN